MSDDEQLPEAWLRTFDGTDLEGRQDVSTILATVDEDGWPHVDFLSVGEVLVRDAAHLIPIVRNQIRGEAVLANGCSTG